MYLLQLSLNPVVFGLVSLKKIMAVWEIFFGKSMAVWEIPWLSGKSSGKPCEREPIDGPTCMSIRKYLNLHVCRTRSKSVRPLQIIRHLGVCEASSFAKSFAIKTCHDCGFHQQTDGTFTPTHAYTNPISMCREWVEDVEHGLNSMRSDPILQW